MKTLLQISFSKFIIMLTKNKEFIRKMKQSSNQYKYENVLLCTVFLLDIEDHGSSQHSSLYSSEQDLFFVGLYYSLFSIYTGLLVYLLFPYLSWFQYILWMSYFLSLLEAVHVWKFQSRLGLDVGWFSFNTIAISWVFGLFNRFI